MKRPSARLISPIFKPITVPTLGMLTPARQIGPSINVPPSAGLATIEPEEMFSEVPKKSLRKRKAVVLGPQPPASDSELSSLSEEESVKPRKPPKKKRKVATKTEVVEGEESFTVAGEVVRTTKRKRKVKASMAEEETLGHIQENETPKKSKRKPKVIEPVVYDIPDVVKKNSTFKGMLSP